MYITPCISICRFDPFTGICIGCNRTQAQKDAWEDMTESERMAIMKELGYGKRMSREERLRRYDKG